MSAEQSKLCRACDETLPVAAFRRQAKAADGYDARCKSCMATGRAIAGNEQQTEAGGSYRKMTPERIDAYLEARRQGMFRGEAARSIGVTSETVRVLRNADPVFADAELDAQDAAIETLERVAWDKAKEGHVTLLLFLLQNLSRGSAGAHRYRDMRSISSQVHVSGTVELDAGPALERIAALTATLTARAALKAPGELELPILDAEVLDEQ